MDDQKKAPKEIIRATPSGQMAYFTAFDMVKQLHYCSDEFVGNLNEIIPAHVVTKLYKDVEVGQVHMEEVFKKLRAGESQTPALIAELATVTITYQIILHSICVTFGIPEDTIFTAIVNKLLAEAQGQSVPVPTVMQIIEYAQKKAEEGKMPDQREKEQ